MSRNQNQRNSLARHDLLYIGYNHASTEIVKACNASGRKRDADFFKMGLNFALAHASNTYLKYGDTLSPQEGYSYDLCMELFEKYNLPKVFESINSSYMLHNEYQIWG